MKRKVIAVMLLVGTLMLAACGTIVGTAAGAGIGSSEAYHIYISNRPGRVRPGSVGEVVPGYSARVLDEHGQEVADGEVGTLWIEGDTAALLYWNEHEKTKQTFQGDLVNTGDLFVRDSEGFYWYRGRSDELIKVGGIWVAPAEIEHSLITHADVVECAVVGYEEEGLTLSRAHVVLRAGVDPVSLTTVRVTGTFVIAKGTP